MEWAGRKLRDFIKSIEKIILEILSAGSIKAAKDKSSLLFLAAENLIKMVRPLSINGAKSTLITCYKPNTLLENANGEEYCYSSLRSFMTFNSLLLTQVGRFGS